MRTAIITAAGISERFNKGIPEDEKQLKIVLKPTSY
jgi:choline kinase